MKKEPNHHMALVIGKKAFKQFYKPFVTKVNSTKQKSNDMDYTFWNTLINSVLVIRPNTITKGKHSNKQTHQHLAITIKESIKIITNIGVKKAKTVI